MSNTITRLINNRYELKIETSKDIKTNIDCYYYTLYEYTTDKFAEPKILVENTNFDIIATYLYLNR